MSNNLVVVDNASKTINVQLPFGLQNQNLVVNFKTAPDITVIPQSGSLVDFSKSIFFTFSNKDGQKAIYTVKVTSIKRPVVEITGINVDTVEAGTDFVVKGKHFGLNPNIISMAFMGENLEEKLDFQLIDSSQLKVSTSTRLKTGLYSLKVQVDKNFAVASKKTFVQYPRPVLKPFNVGHVLNTDTLAVQADFVENTNLFTLTTVGKNIAINAVANTGSILKFPLNSSSFGKIEFALKNISTGYISTTKQPLFVYDANKPFIVKILDQKVYQQKESVLLQGHLLDVFPQARFFQVKLFNNKNEYFVNGLVDNKNLRFAIPSSATSGAYNLSFALIDTIGNEIYQFSIDPKITVK